MRNNVVIFILVTFFWSCSSAPRYARSSTNHKSKKTVKVTQKKGKTKRHPKFIDPKTEIVPCKTFDECFLRASKDSSSKIIIPESNRITGNIGIEYLIFEYRLNIYSEYFQKIEHNFLLIDQNLKKKEIKEEE